jgi:hypothetical protein
MNIAGVTQMLKKEHDRLSKQLQGISAALAAFGGSYAKTGTRTISAAGRAKIAAAQKARWAKVKADGGTKNVVAMPKRTMSPAARKKIAAAQRLRWAKVKAAKKTA